MAAERIKAAHPEAKIVLGGPAATSLAYNIMRECACVDFVVRGEGDMVFPRFLKNLSENSEPARLPGIIFRNGDTFAEGPAPERIYDLDLVPFPSRSLLPLEEYRQTIPIITARGCPYRCSFCDGGALRGQRCVMRSIENVMAESMECASRTGIRDVAFLDDTFVLSRERVLAFCDAFARLDTDFQWGAMGRIDLMDETMFRRMADAGCSKVYFGAESGSDVVLKRIRKGFTSKDVSQQIRAATRCFEKVTVSFIWGFPFETLADFYDTLTLVAECRFYGAMVQLHLLSPMPGSELYEEYGHDLRFSEDAVSDIVCSDYDVECFREFIMEHPEICASFYHYACPDFEKKLGVASGNLDN
jgi:radical SAM superfamily enzyme YgiQ (UPF0313 family)